MSKTATGKSMLIDGRKERISQPHRDQDPELVDEWRNEEHSDGWWKSSDSDGWKKSSEEQSFRMAGIDGN